MDGLSDLRVQWHICSVGFYIFTSSVSSCVECCIPGASSGSGRQLRRIVLQANPSNSFPSQRDATSDALQLLPPSNGPRNASRCKILSSSHWTGIQISALVSLIRVHSGNDLFLTLMYKIQRTYCFIWHNEFEWQLGKTIRNIRGFFSDTIPEFDWGGDVGGVILLS